MEVRCILLKDDQSVFGYPQSKVINAFFIEKVASSVRVADTETRKQYFVTEDEWESASRSPCPSIARPPNPVIGYVPFESVQARVLGIGEKFGGIHSTVYDFLTPEERRALTGFRAKTKEGILVGPKEAILSHEKSASRTRNALLCKALSSKLNSNLFASIYIPGTPPQTPQTVLDFLKIINFETERGPFTEKRLLGNSFWIQTDLLWQYCELGLCPLQTRVFETEEECQDFVFEGEGNSLGEVIIINNKGNAIRNLYSEMQDNHSNPRLAEERTKYTEENPESKAVKDLKNLDRCYTVSLKGTPFQYIPEIWRKDYSTEDGFLRAQFLEHEREASLFPNSDGLEALSKSITKELIYAALNPAICDETRGGGGSGGGRGESRGGGAGSSSSGGGKRKRARDE